MIPMIRLLKNCFMNKISMLYALPTYGVPNALSVNERSRMLSHNP